MIKVKYKGKEYKIFIPVSVIFVILICVMFIGIQTGLGAGITNGKITNLEVVIMNLWLMGMTIFGLTALTAINISTSKIKVTEVKR